MALGEGGFVAAKGAIALSPASNGGKVKHILECFIAPKGYRTQPRVFPISRTGMSCPFRANPLIQCFPGLKPWAESYSPFGATNRAKIFFNLAPFSPAFQR
jgi:hypothetical protein